MSDEQKLQTEQNPAALFDGVKKKATPAGDASESSAPVSEDPARMFSDLKKKKKKKPLLDLSALGGSVPVSIPDSHLMEMEAEPAPANEAAPTVASDAFDPNLLGEKKKKKKKGKADVSLFEALLKDEGGLESTGDAAAEGAEGAESAEGAAEGAFGAASGENADDAWTKSDRDYDYSELLARVFKILRQNNPELAGDKKRYIITPPIVFREGAKRTIFANVVDLCKRMHRQPDHVIQFLFAELGTTGSIDGAQRLVIKGRFQPKQIENVLKRYIVEYVTCKTCKSPDTILTKEARLYFMHCEACGSARTVSTIKTGFMAQTTKRSVARAAAGV